MIAAKLANLKFGDNKGHGRPQKGSAQVPTLSAANSSQISIPEAAEKLNVGVRTVSACRKVQRDGVPELVKAVEDGE